MEAPVVEAAPETAADEVSSPPETESRLEETQPGEVQNFQPIPIPAVSEPKTSPRRPLPPRASTSAPASRSVPENQKMVSRPRTLWLVLLLLLFCLVAAWLVFQFTPLST